MITAILMGVIVFMAMFLGRFVPWERLCRHHLSSFETAFGVVFSIALPFTLLILINPLQSGRDMLLEFWGLCAASALGSALSSLIVALMAASSRADEAEEREEKLIRRIKK